MNLQAFITSGILELYVNGLVTPEEAREVEAVAAQHPEVQAEIDAIRHALDAYVSAHAVRPPNDLKDKIMQRLDGTPKPKPKDKPSQSDSAVTYQKPVRQEAGNSNVSNIAAWILGIALLGSLIAIYLFWQQAERATAQMQAAKDQIEQVRKDCDAEKAKANEVNEQFIAIRHWATKPVQMKATPIGGSAYAVVYWNNIKKTTYLDLGKLPEPAADKQFQLWAIVDGKPTDMGVFNVAENSNLIKIEGRFIENPQAFAVTLEPKGGSESPTLDQMWVVGNVAKG